MESTDAIDERLLRAPLCHGETYAEKRRVHARIIHGKDLRDTFVAGDLNMIRCWIGLPDGVSAVADKAIPGIAIPPEGLDLTAELRWDGQPDSSVLHLPAHRTSRSSDCDLRIKVPADTREVVAEIMFRYRGRCFEAVEIRAAALPPGVPTRAGQGLRIRVLLSRREVIALPHSQLCGATLVFGRGNVGVYAGEGGRTYRLESPTQPRDWLSAQLVATQLSLVRRRGDDAAAGLPVLDTEDEGVRILIRDLARYGAGLFNQLGRLDPGERFQVLTLDPDAIVPLEFVYDRGNPDTDAVLCQGWKTLADLAEDHAECPACGPAPATLPLHPKVICPLGFWSIRRVIERLDPDIAATSSVALPQRRDLPPITSAVFASSSRVPAADRESAWAIIRGRIPHAVLAGDWDAWAAAVSDHPRLLVALPHHGEDSFEDYLQIGDETLDENLARLRRSMIGPEYVNPDGSEPGPIMLLLGCRTGVESELGYIQLVREFEKLKTSIVLGTHDQVLGRHAASVAAELVSELVTASGPLSDFGSMMRRIRCRMLGRGYLMAFGLIALGDAEWRLTPVASLPQREQFNALGRRLLDAPIASAKEEGALSDAISFARVHALTPDERTWLARNLVVVFTNSAVGYIKDPLANAHCLTMMEQIVDYLAPITLAEFGLANARCLTIMEQIEDYLAPITLAEFGGENRTLTDLVNKLRVLAPLLSDRRKSGEGPGRSSPGL